MAQRLPGKNKKCSKTALPRPLGSVGHVQARLPPTLLLQLMNQTTGLWSILKKSAGAFYLRSSHSDRPVPAQGVGQRAPDQGQEI